MTADNAAHNYKPEVNEHCPACRILSQAGKAIY